MTKFRAFWVEQTDDGVRHSLIDRQTGDLPAGEVLVEVSYSSLNYKDALSAKAMPGVTRNYPHTPGIDAAGIVRASESSDLAVGDEVLVIGFDLGMNTPGGYGQYIRVPANWVTPLPDGLTLRESMLIGTAGLTAALCLDKLLRMGAVPEDGPVLVTGATGGVGSVAVSLLASQGFEVVASTGKSDRHGYLKSLGASRVLDRAILAEANPRPLGKPEYAHGVDTVGGETLSNAIKSLHHSGSLAICGLVASPAFDITVLPFILRNVNLLGVDSVELPIEEKNRIWGRLASDWRVPGLEDMAVEIGLDQLSAEVDRILAGKMVGRTLVKLP